VEEVREGEEFDPLQSNPSFTSEDMPSFLKGDALAKIQSIQELLEKSKSYKLTSSIKTINERYLIMAVSPETILTSPFPD